MEVTNICSPKRETKFIFYKLLQITSIIIMDRKTMQKMNKEIEDLDNAINQIDLTEIYQTLHATIAKYTFFSGVH